MSGRAEVERAVEAEADRVAGERGVHVVDVAFAREGRSRVLRVTIDREGGVGLDDCENFSRRLEERLDAGGVVDGPYLLEVASPGLDRILNTDREFAYFSGREIEVTTYSPVQGRKRLVGTLLGLRDGHVEMRGPDGEHWSVPRSQVARARLHAEF